MGAKEATQVLCVAIPMLFGHYGKETVDGVGCVTRREHHVVSIALSQLCETVCWKEEAN